MGKEKKDVLFIFDHATNQNVGIFKEIKAANNKEKYKRSTM